MLATALLLSVVGPPGAWAQERPSVSPARAIQAAAEYRQLLERDPAAFELPNGLFRVTEAGRVPSRVEGSARLPIVLALFADSPEPHITREMIQTSLFDGPSEHGTITDAYLEMSRGALEVGGDVFPWVRTGVTLEDAMSCGVVGCGSWYVGALESVDLDVDFTLYDSDGPDGIPDSGDDDGVVDILTIEYLEVAASCGGPAIWPHRSSIRGRNNDQVFVTNDLGASGEPIVIDGYITQSVADCSGLLVQDASVISHEFGHVLGQPDYYHPTARDGAVPASGRRWVIGCWALMAAGGWGCGPHTADRGFFGPTHMMAHTKHELGWIEYIEPGDVWNEEIVLDPVQASGVALRVPLGSGGTEFLIAEYRGLIGYDAQLPAAGVLMYKQDVTASRRPGPESGDPYFLTVLEQDDDDGLLRNTFEGGDRGTAGDVWGVGGASRALHASSSPALRLSDGGVTSVTVHEVSVDDGRARLVISTAPTPIVVPPAAAFEVTRIESFERSLRIAGGEMPYAASGTLPEGVTLSTAGDRLLITGSLLEEGPHELVLRVDDADGDTSSDVALTIRAPHEWVPVPDDFVLDLLQPGAAALSQGERDYLDAVGNANGRFDVGDLRKWLREND